MKKKFPHHEIRKCCRRKIAELAKIDVHLPPRHLFILIILFPLFLMIMDNSFIGINFKGHLNGFFETPQKEDFSVSAYAKRDYQKKFESWFKFNIGLRGYFIRLYNQIHFTLFNLSKSRIVGKNGNFFEWDYIDAECGLSSKFDFSIPENLNRLDNYVDHLESLQNKLAKVNKHLIFFITPSKAVVDFNDIPLKYRLKKKDSFLSPYLHLRKKLCKKKINLIDSRNFLSKDGIPDFYKTGIHWARPLEQRTSKAVVEKMSALTNQNLPKLNLGHIKKSKVPFLRDADIYNVANLIFKPQGTYYEYEVKIDTTKNYQEPNFLIQGGSFADGLFAFDYTLAQRNSYRILYNKAYSKKNGPYIPIKKWEDINFTEILNNVKVVIIETNEAYIPNFNDGFVEYLDSFLDSYNNNTQTN